MRRRTFLSLTAAAALLPLTAQAAGKIDVELILNDPDSPVAGDPHGDVTIVAFLDYNCPFCKKSTPALEKVVAEDGHVRLVYKDWPILTKASVDGAKMALAAKYQGKYHEAHVAMMALKGRSTVEQMSAAIAAAGVDMARLQADLDAHLSDIAALIKRDNDEAEALGLEGTPVFLIGPFKVAAALDEDGFKRTIEQTRARQKGG
ncbi:MAG: DsbA family protein [Pseudomonadota bacterium]|nr:DsbA family protein [Pseudomonadota bacterium]